jgi:hypothetical protein
MDMKLEIRLTPQQLAYISLAAASVGLTIEEAFTKTFYTLKPAR